MNSPLGAKANWRPRLVVTTGGLPNGESANTEEGPDVAAVELARMNMVTGSRPRNPVAASISGTDGGFTVSRHRSISVVNGRGFCWYRYLFTCDARYQYMRRIPQPSLVDSPRDRENWPPDAFRYCLRGRDMNQGLFVRPRIPHQAHSRPLLSWHPSRIPYPQSSSRIARKSPRRLILSFPRHNASKAVQVTTVC